ncbi:MAG TPA: hypothetical protein VG328_05065 [Stellaceae bacterium]|jgi:hypothetical protein|nr:hypothetical protein [Stellaceae bacterium]
MSEQLQLRRDTQANVAAAIPAAGELALDTTRNALLVGDGATAGGTASALLALFGGYLTGRYYFCGSLISSANFTLGANNLLAVPFFCLQKQIFTKIGVNVTTTGGNLRLGVYASTAGAVPSTLVPGSDSGTFSVTTTGIKETTGLSIALTPGLYHLAIVGDASVGVTGVTPCSQFQNLTGIGSTSPTTLNETGFLNGFVFGAMPATFPSPAAVGNGSVPGIWLRL